MEINIMYKYITKEELDKIANKAEIYNGGIIYLELDSDSKNGKAFYNTSDFYKMPNYEAMLLSTASIVNDYLSKCIENGLEESTAMENLFAAMCLVKK